MGTPPINLLHYPAGPYPMGILINPFSLASGGSPTYTERDVNTAANSGSTICASAGAQKNIASKFTAGASYTISRVDLYLDKVGSPTQDLTLEIWSDGGTYPGAIIGTASAAVNAATLPTSEGLVSFFPSAAITSGSSYFIVLRSPSSDAANYFRWYRNSVSSLRIDQSGDAVTWSNVTVSRRSKFKLFSSP